LISLHFKIILKSQPDFDPSIYQYNIALLILSTPIQFDVNVQPACIPNDPTFPIVNTDGTRFGWVDMSLYLSAKKQSESQQILFFRVI
jgi:hypothetical protein